MPPQCHPTLTENKTVVAKGSMRIGEFLPGSRCHRCQKWRFLLDDEQNPSLKNGETRKPTLKKWVVGLPGFRSSKKPVDTKRAPLSKPLAPLGRPQPRGRRAAPWHRRWRPRRQRCHQQGGWPSEKEGLEELLWPSRFGHFGGILRRDFWQILLFKVFKQVRRVWQTDL